MKRNLTCLLLALAVVICALFALVPQAQATETESSHVGCICGGNLTEAAIQASGHTCTQVQWSPLNVANLLDHFKLVNGAYEQKETEVYLYLTESIDIAGYINVISTAKLHLDLNGYTLSNVTAEGALRILRVVGQVTICDSSALKTGKLESTPDVTSDVDHGACIRLISYTSSKFFTPSVDIYGGTVTTVNQTAANTAGGVIAIGNNASGNATVTQYGGTIQGGLSNNGGGIYINGGSFTIYDGTVTGGEAATGKHGGNINASGKNSIVNIHGGTITGGTAGTFGGNIYMTGAKLNMYSGVVSNGTATAGSGGNISLDGAAVFNALGGSILDGTAQNYGGNISANATSVAVLKDLTISGGSAMRGGALCTYEKSTTSVTMENCTVSGGYAVNYGGNIANGSGNAIVLVNTTLQNGESGSRGGNIYISAGGMNATGCTFSGGVAKNYGGNANFLVDVTMENCDVKNGVAYIGGNIFVDAGIMTVTGGCVTDGNVQGKSGVLGSYTANAGGNIYLYDGQVVLSGVTVSGGKAKLGGNAYINAGSFTIEENSQISAGEATENGGNIYNNAALTATSGYIADGIAGIFGGNVFADGASVTDLMNLTLNGGSAMRGGAVCTNEGSTAVVTMDNCTVSGGYADNFGGNIANGSGNAIVLVNTTLQNGESGSRGGNIYISAGGMNATGCTFFGGVAKNCGGNAYFVVDAAMTQCIVENGSAYMGGNIFVTGGIATVSGGSITGGDVQNKVGNLSGYATNSGGNIYLHSGKIELSGATVSGGKAKNGGNIYINTKTTLSLQDAVISNGTASTNGGNLYICGSGADVGTVTMVGGSIIGGEAVNQGGGIYNQGVFTLNSGSISNGIADEGGNVYSAATRYTDSETNEQVLSARFVMNGGNISDGAARNGGNIQVMGYAEFNAGLISGGWAANTGGNIRLFRPCVVIIESDVTVSAGASGKGGSNLGIGGGSGITNGSHYATLTINGTKFSGFNGACIFVESYVNLNVNGIVMDADEAEEDKFGLMVFGDNNTVTLSGNLDITTDGYDLAVGETGSIHFEELADAADLTFFAMRTGLVATAVTDPNAYLNSDAHKISIDLVDDVYEISVNGLILGEDGVRYESIAEAITAGNCKLVLMADYDGVFALAEDLYIDLRGQDFSGTCTTNNYRIYGMDSETDEYSIEDMGYFSCVDENGAAIVPVHNFMTEDLMRYMTIAYEIEIVTETTTEEGTVTTTEIKTVYTFHRFYLGITKISLAPNVTGFGYKAEFYGDEMVQEQIASIGYNLWITEDHVISRTADFKNTLTLRLKNFDAANYGETPVNSSVTMTLLDGTVIEGAVQSNTLRNVVEAVAADLAELSEEQISALKNMVEKNAVMKEWAIGELLAEELVTE